jgi:hypothetical protein
MSQRELVDAYVDGRISRRAFIRRLAATGVALSAAATYAAALSGEAYAAHTFAECKDKFLRDGDKKKYRKCLENLDKHIQDCKDKFRRDGDKKKFQACMAKLGAAG